MNTRKHYEMKIFEIIYNKEDKRIAGEVHLKHIVEIFFGNKMMIKLLIFDHVEVETNNVIN